MFKKLFFGLIFFILCFVLLQQLKPLAFSSQDWLAKDNLIERNKLYLDEEFNQGESLVVIFALSSDFFQQKNIDELNELEQQIRHIQGIKRTRSPASAKTIFKDDEGTLHNISFTQALTDKLINLETYPDKLKNSPYWLRLISKDSRYIAIAVTVDIDLDKDNHPLRQSIYQQLQQIVEQSSYKKVYYTGETELLYRIDSLSQSELERLLPISAIVLFLLLLLIYRRISYPIISLLVVSISLLITFHLILWMGYPFNVVSSILPILIIVISLADSVHIIRRWQANQAISTESKRAIMCFKETWLPCLFTSLSTSVGFGVFYFSELIPLREFGIVSFVCILAIFPVIMFFTSTFLYLFNPSGPHKPKKQLFKEIQLSALMPSLLNHRYKIVWASGLAIAVILLISPLATNESNFLNVFFKPQSPTAQGFYKADAHLSGSGSFDIILQSNRTGEFKNIAPFRKIKKYTKLLAAIKDSRSIESLLEPVKMVHQPLSERQSDYPNTDDELAQELLFLEFSRSDIESDVLSQSVDFDYTNSRIHIYTSNMRSSQVKKLYDKVVAIFDDNQYKKIITGINVYFQQLSAYVLETQFSSMLLTSLVTLFMFILLFGFRLGSVATLVSFIPIGLILGIQIMLGIPFDFATVLVVSIAIGLCIDDTAHFLHRYKHYLKTNQSIKDCLSNTINDLQQPIVTTSLLLMAGFFVLSFSELVVIFKFSWLTNSAILLSVLAVFLLLPVFLFLNHKKTRST